MCHRKKSLQLSEFVTNVDFNGNTTLMINDMLQDTTKVLLNDYFKGDVLA